MHSFALSPIAVWSKLVKQVRSWPLVTDIVARSAWQFQSLIWNAWCAQAAPAVQLRKVKQEPEEQFSPSSQADSVQDKAHANKSGVSALKGFWETQSTAKLHRWCAAYKPLAKACVFIASSNLTTLAVKQTSFEPRLSMMIWVVEGTTVDLLTSVCKDSGIIANVPFASRDDMNNLYIALPWGRAAKLIHKE